PRGRLRRHLRRRLRPPRRAGVHRRRSPAAPAQRHHPDDPRGHRDRDLRLPEAHQANVRVGYEMNDDVMFEAARDHLWMHFTRLSAYAESDVPVIVRGSGPYVYDSAGKRYLDGLSGLFVVQVGHGRTELA